MHSISRPKVLMPVPLNVAMNVYFTQACLKDLCLLLEIAKYSQSSFLLGLHLFQSVFMPHGQKDDQLNELPVFVSCFGESK